MSSSTPSASNTGSSSTVAPPARAAIAALNPKVPASGTPQSSTSPGASPIAAASATACPSTPTPRCAASLGRPVEPEVVNAAASAVGSDGGNVGNGSGADAGAVTGVHTPAPRS